MTHPIAADGPLLTVRNLAVVIMFIAVVLVLGLVAARTGHAQTATQIQHFYHSGR
jgi:hypothetical protein